MIVLCRLMFANYICNWSSTYVLSTLNAKTFRLPLKSFRNLYDQFHSYIIVYLNNVHMLLLYFLQYSFMLPFNHQNNLIDLGEQICKCSASLRQVNIMNKHNINKTKNILIQINL